MEQRPVSGQVCLCGESVGPGRTIKFLTEQVCFHTTHIRGKLVYNNTIQATFKSHLILRIVKSEKVVVNSTFLVSLDGFAGSAGL